MVALTKCKSLVFSNAVLSMLMYSQYIVAIDIVCSLHTHTPSQEHLFGQKCTFALISLG